VPNKNATQNGWLYGTAQAARPYSVYCRHFNLQIQSPHFITYADELLTVDVLDGIEL